jgi:hypothetical protein
MLVVGCTTAILSFGVIIEGKVSKERVCTEVTGGCGNDCEAKSEPYGTATLLSCTPLATMKSLSRNGCCTNIYCAAF